MSRVGVDASPAARMAGVAPNASLVAAKGPQRRLGFLRRRLQALNAATDHLRCSGIAAAPKQPAGLFPATSIQNTIIDSSVFVRRRFRTGDAFARRCLQRIATEVLTGRVKTA